jgi:hypothetical protein
MLAIVACAINGQLQIIAESKRGIINPQKPRLPRIRTDQEKAWPGRRQKSRPTSLGNQKLLTAELAKERPQRTRRKAKRSAPKAFGDLGLDPHESAAKKI